jgi:serine/threonine-protein kinase
LALTPGTRLGPYEITAPLGAGGMGEVYRARDTKLDRDVALKVLPESFIHDPDRLARFQREAKVLAALNHPNIAHIHGLEESNGVRALVMELVEGEDLAQRLARGAIPIDEALPIAKQIAEALEAAHEQGIIHRDLKPANIKVKPDGAVKVLDFGLAKALEPTGSRPDSSESPTITSPAMTHAGIILGTAAYMSPEQAKGRAVDKRADIWAFGVVLYEMLTGQRAFTGEDVSDVLVAVLSKDVNLSALPSGTPPRFLALVRDCLARDPKQRLRDIGDARIVLAKIIAGAPDSEIGLTAPTAAVTRSSSRVLPWTLASAFALIAIATLILWAPWREKLDRPLVQLDVDLGPDVALPSAERMWGTIAISPDGTRLVFISGTPPRLFTRRLDQPKASELPGTVGASSQPFFSPDGRWVGFSVGTKVNKISVDGGAIMPIGQVSNFGGASWAEDDSIFVGEAFGRGLLQFPAAGGPPKVVAAGDNGVLVVPQLLPGGKAILFAECATNATGADSCNIEVLTLADGRRRILAHGGHSPHYLPSSNGTGHLAYVNKATLFAIPFNLGTLETSGTAVPVLNDVAYQPSTGSGLFDVSRTGTLIYRSRTDAAVMTTVQWVDSTGKKEVLRAKSGAYRDVTISPDGKRILLVISEGANQDVWVYDPRRDGITRLTFGGVNGFPQWSPDSQYVVYLNRGHGMFQARADGARPPQALTESTNAQIPSSFTPDGKRLAYVATAPRRQIWTIPLEDQGGQLKAGTPQLFVTSNFIDEAPSFSVDGRWLAYQSNESGQNEVYVRPFPPSSSGQGGKWQVSNNGGGEPRWAHSGHELVYRSGDQLMTVSYSVNGDAFVAEKPRVWIATPGATSWDIAPDGRHVAELVPESILSTPQQEHEIVMLLNFADELRRRGPLGK